MSEKYNLWNPFTDQDAFLPYRKIGPMTVAGGEGCWAFNERGEKFLNASSGLWNLSLGYGRKDLVRAAADQMEQLPYASLFQQTHPKAMELASGLCRITEGRYEKAYLGCNGTEVTEAAVKMVRQYFAQSRSPKKKVIFSFKGSYHGVSMLAVTESGDEKNRELFGPPVPGVRTVDPPDAYHGAYGTRDKSECEKRCLEAVEQAISDEGEERAAAFIAEPVMGENHILDMSVSFMEELVKLCHRHGMLFIADEVTTGFGRTGPMFASLQWKEVPDILCLGKGISSGYLPLAAALATAKVYDGFTGKGREFQHGSTASGHPVCSAVGLAVINAMEKENVLDNVKKQGERLKKGLVELKDSCSCVGDVRGRGLMYAVELVKDRASREPLDEETMFQNVADAASQGVMLYYRENVIDLFPPLVVCEEEIDMIISVLKKALDTSKMAKLAQKGRMAKMMVQAVR